MQRRAPTSSAPLTDPTSGGSKNYCVACATAILDRAQEDLDDLGAELVA